MDSATMLLLFILTIWYSYVEWWRILPSDHQGGGVSIIFLFGQIFYDVAVLDLKKKKKIIHI